MKTIRVFLSENFQFLEVKFSMYLYRRVFVMQTIETSASLRILAIYPASALTALLRVNIELVNSITQSCMCRWL